MRFAKAGLLLFLALTLRPAFGQTTNETQGSNPARSPVILLPDYRLQIVKGIDTSGAVIWKENGLAIDFSRGMYLEDPVKSEKENHILWKQEQSINGKKVQFVYTTSHQLIVNFPDLHAYFYARIHSSQQLAEMLLMAVTYDIREYPVDPSLLGQLRKPKK